MQLASSEKEEKTNIKSNARKCKQNKSPHL